MGCGADGPVLSLPHAAKINMDIAVRPYVIIRRFSCIRFLECERGEEEAGGQSSDVTKQAEQSRGKQNTAVSVYRFGAVTMR
jgi:hypothetical protein